MRRKLVWKMLLIGCSLLAINAWGNKTISFTADLTGNLDIYIIDINRKNLVNLTDHPGRGLFSNVGTRWQCFRLCFT